MGKGNMMNKRERVRAAIEHRQPDKVPWLIHLSTPARAMLADYYGDQTLSDASAFDTWMDNHMTIVVPWHAGFHELKEEVSQGLWRDGFGVVWDTRGLYGEGEWGRPINCQLPEPTLKGYTFPEPPGPEHFLHYPDFIRQNQDLFLIAVGGHLFEPAWALRGMENLLVDMIQQPGFVDELMDHLMDYYLAVIDRLLEFDVDAIHFGDDWGSERGLLMGPKYWRKFIKPRMARMWKRVKEAGKFVFLHSDGDVSAIFEDLIEIGLDVYNPLQPEIFDMSEIKRKYGDRLCFWGGIGLRGGTLLVEDASQVRQTVQRTIKELGKDGGYILAQAHPDGILGDVPVANIAALIETVKGQ
jgi:uroporphyrinogen decarboxylase